MIRWRIMDLTTRRQFYAEEVCAIAGVVDPVLVGAFATVPRERFLGPGPWSIAVTELLPSDPPYRISPDGDPAHVLHNVVVAIDPARQLNNGHPSALAAWIAALRVRRGDRVVHVGCGVGYYTAILAELVGPDGSVTGIEVDTELAARAQENLADRSWVTVVAGDGTHVPSPVDAIFVNAGCTRPHEPWLDALAPAGRLLLPLTGGRGPHGVGAFVRIVREPDRFSASWISRVGIYACAIARDPSESDVIGELISSMRGGSPLLPLRTLRRTPHDRGADCVLHTDQYCLSTG
jgi:protein-L-isoaspartate(D-aspartate) O-methyltransferase